MLQCKHMAARPETAALPARDRLLSLIEAFAGRPVLMVADLVLDRYLYGAPKRVSREAPVLILQLERETLVPGGGANAAVNVRALDGTPVVAGRVGDDQAGGDLVALLDARQVETGLILRTRGVPTPIKTRVLGGAPPTLQPPIVRLDTGEPAPLDEGQQAELISRIEGALARLASRPTVAVMSDYGYGAADPSWAPRVRQLLGHEARLLVDSRYRCNAFPADATTPNQEEAEALVGRPLTSAQDILDAAPRLLAGRPFILVTRGSQGMALIEPAGDRARVAFIPAAGAHRVTDVTGAGDTVIGAFALALAAGADALEAALLANFAGGVVVSKPGTATADRRELAAAVKGGEETLARVALHSGSGS